MKPRVTLRQALDDPSLLGAALAGPSWHAWRSLVLAAMGEPLQPDELETSRASLVARHHLRNVLTSFGVASADAAARAARWRCSPSI